MKAKKEKKQRGKYSPEKLQSKGAAPIEQAKDAVEPVVEKKKDIVETITEFAEEWAKPLKREYSAKELAQRERDMKVNYSSVVPEKMRKQLDAERKENWKSPDEVQAMPQWKPVIDPVVDKVISERVKEVKLFMETIDRSEKEIVVTKLTGLVKKQLPDKDIDLIEKAIWRRLFDLAKDQGVSNIGKMKDVL